LHGKTVGATVGFVDQAKVKQFTDNPGGEAVSTDFVARKPVLVEQNDVTSARR
jgi:hypothetical protein